MLKAANNIHLLIIFIYVNIIPKENIHKILSFLLKFLTFYVDFIHKIVSLFTKIQLKIRKGNKKKKYLLPVICFFLLVALILFRSWRFERQPGGDYDEGKLNKVGLTWKRV